MLTNFVAATNAELLEQRSYLLLAAMAAALLIAGPLAYLAARRRRSKIVAELSDLTGTKDGIKSGSDSQHVDDEWWAKQNAEDGGGRSNPARWQTAMLPPGARPDTTPPTPVPSHRTAPPPAGSHRAPQVPPPAAEAARPRPDLPPIAARPAPPQPSPNPVVQAPAGSLFNGADEDQSFGDDWFDRAEKEDQA